MEPQTRTPLFEKRPTESEAKDHSNEESSTRPKTNPDQQQPITPDGDSTTCRVILSQLIIPDGDLRKYLWKQLSVQRLNDIHLHLWWAGRPDNIRPLHAQKVMKRDIVITENIDLHLIWFDTTIYIKPLPAFIIDWDFFKTNICPDEDLYKLANGFLKTYTKLIQHPSDLKIALDMGLVPNTIKWSFWSEFSTMLQPKIDDFQINKRYTFGELRLRRLNHVYRFLRWGGLLSKRIFAVRPVFFKKLCMAAIGGGLYHRDPLFDAGYSQHEGCARSIQ